MSTKIINSIIAILKEYPNIKSCIIASFNFNGNKPHLLPCYSLQLAQINNSPVVVYINQYAVNVSKDNQPNFESILLEYDLKIIELNKLGFILKSELREMNHNCETNLNYNYIRSEHV